MRLLPTAALLVAALAGCSGQPLICPAAGEEPGIAVDIDPAVARRVSGGSMEVCWLDTCRGDRLDIRHSAAGPASAFLVVPHLPEITVRVTLRLTDGSGASVLEETLEVEVPRTNEHECQPPPATARLVVDAEGTVRRG